MKNLNEKLCNQSGGPNRTIPCSDKLFLQLQSFAQAVRILKKFVTCWFRTNRSYGSYMG